MDSVLTHSQMHKHVIAFFAMFVFVSRNLRKTESRKNKLEDLLNSVGARVNELKEKYAIISCFCLSSPSVLFYFLEEKVLWSYGFYVSLLVSCFPRTVHRLLSVTQSAITWFASVALGREARITSRLRKLEQHGCCYAEVASHDIALPFVCALMF